MEVCFTPMTDLCLGQLSACCSPRLGGGRAATERYGCAGGRLI